MGKRIVKDENYRRARGVIRAATGQVVLFVFLGVLVYSATLYVAIVSYDSLWVFLGLVGGSLCTIVGVHSAFGELALGILKATGYVAEEGPERKPVSD